MKPASEFGKGKNNPKKPKKKIRCGCCCKAVTKPVLAPYAKIES